MGLAYQQVLRFDVPVDDALAVTELDRLAQLVDVLLDVVWLFLFYVDSVRSLFEDLEQVALYVLEDEVKLALATKGLFELDYVVVLEHSQNFYLSDRCFADGFVFFGFFELFYGHVLAGFLVACFEDHTVGSCLDFTFADHVDYLVFVHLFIGFKC